MSLSSALSITQSVGVPRTVFVDYPLGRTAGRAGHHAEQLYVVRAAIDAVTTMSEPRSVLRLPHKWSDDDSWKQRAMRPGWSSDGLHAAHASDTHSSGSGDDRAERDDRPQWQSPADQAAWEFEHT